MIGRISRFKLYRIWVMEFHESSQELDDAWLLENCKISILYNELTI